MQLLLFAGRFLSPLCWSPGWLLPLLLLLPREDLLHVLDSQVDAPLPCAVTFVLLPHIQSHLLNTVLRVRESQTCAGLWWDGAVEVVRQRRQGQNKTRTPCSVTMFVVTRSKHGSNTPPRHVALTGDATCVDSAPRTILLSPDIREHGTIAPADAESVKSRNLCAADPTIEYVMKSRLVAEGFLVASWTSPKLTSLVVATRKVSEWPSQSCYVHQRAERRVRDGSGFVGTSTCAVQSALFCREGQSAWALALTLSGEILASSKKQNKMPEHEMWCTHFKEYRWNTVSCLCWDDLTQKGFLCVDIS